MTLTPKQVIEELAKTGRHVEARTLTDWGARGLIPKPIEKGRGRGKGKSYFWTDDNILDRVALVADLPSWETDRTILFLWFCGFEVLTGPNEGSLAQIDRARVASASKAGHECAGREHSAAILF